MGLFKKEVKHANDVSLGPEMDKLRDTFVHDFNVTKANISSGAVDEILKKIQKKCGLKNMKEAGAVFSVAAIEQQNAGQISPELMWEPRIALVRAVAMDRVYDDFGIERCRELLEIARNLDLYSLD